MASHRINLGSLLTLSASLLACAAYPSNTTDLLPDTGPDARANDTPAPLDAPQDLAPPRDTASDLAPPLDAGMDSSPPRDAPVDTAPARDLGSDTSSPQDTGVDTGAPRDTGVDTGMDTGTPRDTGVDTGAPRDTGVDTGAPYDAACVATMVSPVPSGASLYGIHFVPILGDRSVILPRPTWMGGPSGPRLWDVEMISGDAYGWYLFEGGCYDNTTCGALRALSGAGVDLVVRLDDGTDHYTVPTTAAGLAAWHARLGGLFDDRGSGSIRRFARVFIVGNEPNICIEAGGAPGCEPASRAIDPAAYATAYRQTRALLRARAGGAAWVLAAGPSGGGARSFGYLDEVLAQLCSDDVDGFALHAYGGADDDPDRDGTFGFSRDLRRQLASLDSACGGRFRNAGVFVTEFSRGTRILPDSDFIYRVYEFLQGWNRVSANHPVVAATYFLGRGPGFAEENLTVDSPNSHVQSRAAFQRAVAQGWGAGPWGRGSSPSADAGCAVCRCVPGVDNFCNYASPADRVGCPGWEPGGYCNPGSGGAVDWVRGYNDYRARCVTP